MTMKRIGHERTAAGASLAALALALAGPGGLPAAAQETGTPTPTPPSSRPIDFRLPPADEGRTPGVQGPSDNGLPPVAPGERRGVPTPQPVPPRVTPTQPATPTRPAATTPAPTPAPARRGTPDTSTSRSTPNDQSAPTAQAPAPSEVNPPLAPATPAPSDNAEPSATPPVPADDVATEPAPVSGQGGTPIWAWLLAGLAALGAGVWYWRRRPLPAGEAPAEFAPPVQPAPPPRPAPRAASPTARPSAPPARPAPSSPAPAAPPERNPSPLVTRPIDERRAIVGMALDIQGIRMTADQVAVSFALNLQNQGPVAATGLMVRIALGQGSAMPETVLARFFDGAGGSVLRDDMILEPGAGEQLSTEVMLPRAAVEPLMIAGRPMLVPVLAFDVTYHWDGPGDAFGQNAGSFVLGREQGASGSEKLAPLPLDRASHRVDRPGVRATAIRRAQ